MSAEEHEPRPIGPEKIQDLFEVQKLLHEDIQEFDRVKEQLKNERKELPDEILYKFIIVNISEKRDNLIDYARQLQQYIKALTQNYNSLVETVNGVFKVIEKEFGAEKVQNIYDKINEEKINKYK